MAGARKGPLCATTAHRGRKTIMLSLPDDVIIRIFSHLEPAPTLCCLMEVCTRFYKLAVTPQLWVEVKAADAPTRRLRTEEAAGEHRYLYREHDPRYAEIMQPPTGKSALRQKKRRRHGAGFAADVITKRAGSCLRVLDLEECYPATQRYDFMVSDGDLAMISRRCSSSLRELRIGRSVVLTGSGVAAFAMAATGLRVLHINSVPDFVRSHLVAIVAACPLLADIGIKNCGKFSGHKLHEVLGPNRRIFRSINISGTPTAGLLLAKFSGGYPDLEVLNFDQCESLTLKGQPTEINGTMFPSLRALNANRVHEPNHWIEWVCRGSPKLRALSVNSTSHRAPPGFHDFFNPSVPPLQQLEVAGQGITDEIFQRILDNLGASLVHCDVSENRKLTCSVSLQQGQNFARLEELDLSWTATTDNTAKTIIYVSPNLQMLRLQGCRGVVDREMRRDPLRTTSKRRAVLHTG